MTTKHLLLALAVMFGFGAQAQQNACNTDYHDVARSTTQNQAVLTLKDGSVKYYNTADVTAIDFPGGNHVLFSLAGELQDAYKGNVQSLSFTKKQGGIEIIEACGWLESAYAKWALIEGVKGYHVYVKGGQYADFTKIDDQLVRNYGTYGRADVVGLKAGTYELKVIPVVDDAEDASMASTVSDLEIRSYNRDGFAHKGMMGVGAYNDDGTLKAGAHVLYVTKDNFNTITLEMITDSRGTRATFTGLGKIFQAKQKGYDKTPMAVRIIGEINYANTDREQRLSDEDGLQLKGKDASTEMYVTLEGIGDDATFNGFGMTFYNGTSVEMRNLGVINFKDDGIQLKGVQHAWIHHCDIFYGHPGGASDQAKGDGSLDVKDNSRYCTFSYNHFWDSGKTSLCGMKSESGPNYLDYHHNWFDHSDSRHPRVRTMSVHVWNNYYDGVSMMGACAVKGANLFVEGNYFRNTKNPMLISEQGTDGRNGFADDHEGGMIKAYGNVLTGRSLTTFIPHTQNATEFDAYVAATRDEQVPETYRCAVGNHPYNNFDTDATVMHGYTPDAAADVPAVVTGFYGAGRMNHGDLQWTFTEADDLSNDVNAALKAKVTGYHTTLLGIFGEESTPVAPDDPDNPDPDDPDVPEGSILASFDGTPSHSMFTVGGTYGDGKITYNNVYYKKGVKLNSEGSITFTPAKNYSMTIIMGTAKPARDVKINGELTTVSGTENSEGKYYELEPVPVDAGVEYKLTRGSAEGLVMLIKLVER